MSNNSKSQKEQDERYLLSSALFDNAIEAIMITDVNDVIEMVNPAFTTITGYSPEESVGKNESILQSGKHDEKFFQNVNDALQSEGYWRGEIWSKKKSGETFLSKQSIRVLKDEKGKTLKHVSAFYDIVDIGQSEYEIKYKAYHDALTGLPNRMLFVDRFKEAINRAGRNNTTLAVIFIDLDNFKNVNDVLGHAAGDILLKEAGSRLVSCLRKVDTVARFGGDEFTMLLENLTRDHDIIIIARKIIESLSSAFSIKGEEIFVSTSIGISLYPDDGKDVEDLMKNADLAMYHAKELGKGNYQFFTKRMNDKVVERNTLEKSLRKALTNNEMVAYYQPKVNLKTGQIVGMEALVRWNHPNGKIVSPDGFIPLAEETGLIVKIDELMLSAACGFSKELKRKNLTGVHISVNVSVNLSAIVLERKDLVEVIDKRVEEVGLAPHDIELEVTERSIIKNIDFAIETLQRLRDKGYSVSMDDFGTGYSSLSNFTRLPINVLKIDRSFVVNMPTDPKAQYVIKALITMSHELGIKVIAEGVETQEQIDFLILMGCDEMQGYFFSPPIPQDKMEKLLKDGTNCIHETINYSREEMAKRLNYNPQAAI
ncbi:MAG: putative bifunctional diguanylate cyclase/phosphodiesterase [Candidatus Anammoxibacter sp.]